MLGYLIPDALQQLFFELARSSPQALRGTLFAVLCIGFLLGVSRVVRRVLLEIDAAIAAVDRRRATAPRLSAYLVGWTGVLQWWLMLAVCLAFALSTLIFEANREGIFGPAATSTLIKGPNAVHRCLRPGSGRGADTLSSCYLQ